MTFIDDVKTALVQRGQTVCVYINEIEVLSMYTVYASDGDIVHQLTQSGS